MAPMQVLKSILHVSRANLVNRVNHVLRVKPVNPVKVVAANVVTVDHAASAAMRRLKTPQRLTAVRHKAQPTQAQRPQP